MLSSSSLFRRIAASPRFSVSSCCWLRSSLPSSSTLTPLTAFIAPSRPVDNSARAYHATPLCDMPLIKAVELVSLGSILTGGDDSVTKGKVSELPMVEGSLVQAGDVVVKIQVPDAPDVEIRAPNTGRLVQISAHLNASVAIGDTLFTIDTDAVAQTQAQDRNPKIGKLLDDFVQHVHENQGNVTDQYWKETVLADKDNTQQALKQLAALIRDRFPGPLIKSRALPLLEHVLEIQQQQQAGPLAIASTYTDLGIICYKCNYLAEALQHLNRALELRKETLGETHPDLAASHVHLGAIQHHAGDLDGTLASFEKALEIQKANLGEEHALVASSWNNIGSIFYQKGEFPSAVDAYTKALNIQQRTVGENHVDTAGTYNNLGVVIKHTGDFKTALLHVRKALAIRQSVLGSDHLDTAASHYSLAQLLTEEGDMNDAIVEYENAIKVQTQHYGEHHPIPASTINNLGAVYYQQGEFDLALKEYRRGLDHLKRAPGVGDGHPDVAACYNNVGLALYQNNQLEDAMEAHKHAQRILTAHFGKDHPSLATTIGAIGNVLKRKGQPEEALEHYRTSHQMLELELGPFHPDVGGSYNNMGQILAQQGKLDDALEVYKASQKIFEQALGKGHPHVGACHYNIALVLQQQQKADPNTPDQMSQDCQEHLESAKEIWLKSLGPDHMQTKIAASMLEERRL